MALLLHTALGLQPESGDALHNRRPKGHRYGLGYVVLFRPSTCPTCRIEVFFPDVLCMSDVHNGKVFDEPATRCLAFFRDPNRCCIAYVHCHLKTLQILIK